jgi:alpha-ketoglutarate-dependent taurine dioxygenase
MLASVAGLCHPLPAPRSWTGSSAPDPLPEVDAATVMTTDAGVLQWLTAVQMHGFGLVRHLEPNPAAAEALARRVAYPRDTIFGAMWTLSSEVRAHDDSAYSTSFLEPHTDGTYSMDAPGLQMFCCMEREGTGGQSVLVDGLHVAESIRGDDPEAFEILTTVNVPGRYIEAGVHLTATRAPIRLDEHGEIVQISFNNYDRAPLRLPRAEMSEFYRAYGMLHERVNDRSNWIQVRLEPGDVLLFDNWRTLHGRMSYVGRRIFEGCYHNHEDFVSRLITLRR